MSPFASIPLAIIAAYLGLLAVVLGACVVIAIRTGKDPS